ncbi:MAG TPA: hypothetical protein VF150_00680 [Thermoanaerobaculia bacterium]
MTIAFATLFLGLVVGTQPVELVVGADVARVELLLDGQVVGDRAGPPWEVPCDFGEELAPHELVAVALDAEGKELGRARQWINLPRSEAEATVVVEGAEDGKDAVARLSWENLTGEEPLSVSVVFDGEELTAEDPRAIPLPAHDPEQLHFLRAEIGFSANLSAVTEVVFGGAYRGDAATELTAVPVEVERHRRDLEPGALAEHLTVDGSPVTPVAVEEGPAEVVLVMDRRAQEGVRLIAERWRPPTLGAGTSAGGLERNMPGDVVRRNESDVASDAARMSHLQNALRLEEGQSVRFLWPYARVRGDEGVRYALFPRTGGHPPSQGGMLWFLSAVQQPEFSVRDQRLADAVAVAGMAAAGRGRRRAVVLVLSDRPADASLLSPPAVRRYLSHLGVPLHVWAVGSVPDEVAEAWGGVRPVPQESALRRAVEELSEGLERQRIVWIEGLHLPQAVALSEAARGVRRVR